MSDLDLPALRSALLRLVRRLNASTAVTSLTETEAFVLAFVANRGPLQLKDLIEWEGISATVLSRVVGRLSKDGLIRRMPGTKDRRMAMVAVTPKGSRIHRKTREQSVRLLRAALSEMPPGSSQALEQALPVLEELTYKLLDKDLGRADGRRPPNPKRDSDAGNTDGRSGIDLRS